ncbi:MAG TPA: patatin-like phospholipase family protein [Nitrospiria bacterium]|nr:patatin-like phospholipase family protein [Nitrospiria bacterium]
MRFWEKLRARLQGRPKSPPRVALVLGGGAARGFAHVGVIRVLEREKIPIDMIVGTSVGSLIGAIYAAGAAGPNLERIALQLERDDLVDYSILALRKGLIIGDRLERFVSEKVGVSRIEDLKLPFAAVATDIRTGERVILDRGPLATAVHASCALPAVFQPVELDGKLLVDGGVLEPLPVPTAKFLGADVTIAVDVGTRIKKIQSSDVVTVVIQALSISGAEMRRRHALEADVLIHPDVNGVGAFDFAQKERCVEAGAAAAREALPRIREVLSARRILPRRS